MDTTQTLTWQQFKETLLQNPALHLQFQYAESKRVNNSFHITEIKQAPIVSVDCGGVLNNWTEIIVQLWEPDQKREQESMTISKALSIIQIVENKLPLNPSATVKIEFGNSQFDTRQMYPGNFYVENENLVVDLQPDFTQCKAINRGGSCGTAGEEECCEPQASNTNSQMQNLAVASSCCSPGSACC